MSSKGYHNLIQYGGSQRNWEGLLRRNEAVQIKIIRCKDIEHGAEVFIRLFIGNIIFVIKEHMLL